MDGWNDWQTTRRLDRTLLKTRKKRKKTYIEKINWSAELSPMQLCFYFPFTFFSTVLQSYQDVWVIMKGLCFVPPLTVERFPLLAEKETVANKLAANNESTELPPSGEVGLITSVFCSASLLLSVWYYLQKSNNQQGLSNYRIARPITPCPLYKKIDVNLQSLTPTPKQRRHLMTIQPAVLSFRRAMN